MGNSKIGIIYFNKKDLELINLELEFATKKLNPQINLNLEYLLGVHTPISDWNR